MLFHSYFISKQKSFRLKIYKIIWYTIKNLFSYRHFLSPVVRLPLGGHPGGSGIQWRKELINQISIKKFDSTFEKIKLNFIFEHSWAILLSFLCEGSHLTTTGLLSSMDQHPLSSLPTRIPFILLLLGRGSPVCWNIGES